MIYKFNFFIFVLNEDIRKVDVRDILEVDIILFGFLCILFSVVGYCKGFEDEKFGDLFFEILRIIVLK